MEILSGEGARRLGIALFACALVSAACGPEAENTSAAANPPPAAAAPESASAADPAKLAGLWQRSDADYVIAIKSASPDGKLEAAYLNPRPIRVSRAEWKNDAGKLAILVEMTDVNYPGSYYTLAYDPGSDTLNGVYHQKVENVDLEVIFSRLKESPPSAAPSGSDAPRTASPPQ